MALSSMLRTPWDRSAGFRSRRSTRPFSSAPGTSPICLPRSGSDTTVKARVRVTFVNQGSHAHTIHFHGWHPPEMDGSLPEHQVMPGAQFVYEFDADPF